MSDEFRLVSEDGKTDISIRVGYDVGSPDPFGILAHMWSVRAHARAFTSDREGLLASGPDCTLVSSAWKVAQNLAERNTRHIRGMALWQQDHLEGSVPGCAYVDLLPNDSLEILEGLFGRLDAGLAHAKAHGMTRAERGVYDWALEDSREIYGRVKEQLGGGEE